MGAGVPALFVITDPAYLWALTAEGGDKDPAMRALMARTSSIANFMHFP